MVLDSKKRFQGTFDALLELKAAYVVAGAGTVFGLEAAAGPAIVLDVRAGRFDAKALFDVSALVVAGDEEYHLTIEGGVDNAFAAGVPLATLSLGGAANIGGLTANDTPGRFILPFTNERNGVWYRFLRLQIRSVGAGSSITFAGYIVPNQ
jgi:hypothetical protein